MTKHNNIIRQHSQITKSYKHAYSNINTHQNIKDPDMFENNTVHKYTNHGTNCKQMQKHKQFKQSNKELRHIGCNKNQTSKSTNIKSKQNGKQT